jgi:hypothetical protein
MFADYFLQTPRMLAGRSTYFHVGRAQHATVHAAGSTLVFLAMSASLPFILLVVLVEWVIHFHIDWAKAVYSDSRQHTPAQAAFWAAMGADQFAHQLTYVAMCAAWAIVYF